MPILLPKLEGGTLRLLSLPRKRPTLEHPAQEPEATANVQHPISPFDGLPLELQVEIFTHCLPPFPHFNINEGPLLVGRVCSAWRSVVLSTPRFWSSFEIEVTGSGSSIALRDIQIISTMELWLQRSRSHPLSVRVIHIPVGRVPDPRSAQMLALLIPEARRWRHVQFIIPTANMASLRQSFPKEFPSLRSLTLQMKGLWTLEPSIGLSTAGIPWAQLTSLDLQLERGNLPTLNECLEILNQLERVKDCTLGANAVLGSTDGTTTYVPSLESFSLILHEGINSSAAAMSQFLCLLDVPKLHTLDLKWQISGTHSWPTSHRDFVSFLQGTPTLRSLKLSYLPLSEDHLVDCVAHTPFLEDLDLRFSLVDSGEEQISDNFISAMTILPLSAADGRDAHIVPDSPLLPRLTSFGLECNGSRLSFGALFSMIHSRRHHFGTSIAQLDRFKFSSMKTVVGEAERQAGAWADEGMDILIGNILLL